jgi:hypothetical protein
VYEVCASTFGGRQVKGILVQNTGKNILTAEERGWKRRMQKIFSYGAPKYIPILSNRMANQGGCKC